jgi:hypothetical protein
MALQRSKAISARNSAVSPWTERPTIDLNLNGPLEEVYRTIPEAVLADGRRLLDAVIQEVPAGARVLADAVRLRTANRFQREAEVLADLVGATWRDVILANVSYDLVLSQFGCSTVALPTAEGPVIARNMDWWPERVLARSSYVLRFRRGQTPLFCNAGWPGAIGVVTGLSGRGFAIVLNAVSSPEGVSRVGYPVLLHLRRVLEDAADFQEALDLLKDQRLAAPALITLVGTRNEERVVIERTPARHALRWAERDRPLLATNDYRLLFRPESRAGWEIYETTCRRYDALRQLLADHQANEQVEDSRLLYVLSDPAVIQSITAQHIILRPAKGTARLFVPSRFSLDRREE